MDKEFLLNELRRFECDSIKTLILDDTVSTNSDAREMIKNCAPTPILVTAESQSGGRGRMGKTFISPRGGLYMTIALPSNVPIVQASEATPAAAVALIRAIGSFCGIDCGIKWVNDIYANGKKLAGILVESLNDYSTMKSKHLIIGIGVNITTTPTVTDSIVSAISLADLGIRAAPETLCAAIVREVLQIAESGFTAAPYIDEYRRFSIVLGREITFTSNGESRIGTVSAIRDNGSLEVLCENETLILSGGEISVRLN